MDVMEQSETAEADLVAEAQGGSLAAFEGLLHRYELRVFRFILRMLQNQHDAEDATQETFIKAYHALGRYDAKYSFSTWIFTIAKRTALTQMRRRKPHEPLDAEREQSSSESVHEGEPEIWAVARSLKPEQHELLWLHYAEGFSMAEIAAITGRNVIYTKVLLHRARGALKTRVTSAMKGMFV